MFFLPSGRAAHSRLAQSATWVAQATAAVCRHQALHQEREQALAATEAKRHELSQVLSDLDAALEATVAERVLAYAEDHRTSLELMEHPGPLPEAPGQNAVWCALAAQIERFHDRHPGQNPHRQADRWLDPGLYEDQLSLNELLGRAPGLLALGRQVPVDGDPLRDLSPAEWSAQLDQAKAIIPRLAEPALERGLGMDLGW